ncbi:MAG: dienelactone hydrolase family protein [Pseudonocardiales bacterium]|jgi:dienelactone hydrolase|nr:dienelactone hydrolase family protein [Pseudonocardiales bacterium]
MAGILLFHHAQGQTPGFLEFAELLREAGHLVHTPDLYDGKTFADLEEGVAYAERVGIPEIVNRGSAFAQDLPAGLVYAGFSLGALPAQALTQTRPGARGALFFHGGVPTTEFDYPWPAGVPLQIHTMDADEWTEIDVVKELAGQIEDAELFLYPGSVHLFADPSLGDYDSAAAALLRQRTLSYLSRIN